MGLESFDSDRVDISEDTTVGELINIYGEEAVRRGVQYIEKLSEADQNFRQAANNTEKYGEEYSEGVVEGEVDTSDLEQSWAESMEETGLGINDED